MGAFTTLQAAETRARQKVKDKTWVNAHSCRLKDGTIAVRVQRFMAPTSPTTRGHGGWIELTDDGAT